MFLRPNPDKLHFPQWFSINRDVKFQCHDNSIQPAWCFASGVHQRALYKNWCPEEKNLILPLSSEYRYSRNRRTSNFLGRIGYLKSCLWIFISLTFSMMVSVINVSLWRTMIKTIFEFFFCLFPDTYNMPLAGHKTDKSRHSIAFFSTSFLSWSLKKQLFIRGRLLKIASKSGELNINEAKPV